MSDIPSETLAEAEAHVAELEAQQAEAAAAPAPAGTMRVATTSPWNTYHTDDGQAIGFDGIDVPATLAETLVSGAPGVLRIVQD